MSKVSNRAGGGGQQSEDSDITLGVLSAIEADSSISQRTLSNELGVALGLANAYLKRCVRKGYVKITAVPRRRYTYYLTPQGFAEKARLTGDYLTSSLQFFRRARSQLNEIMAGCAARKQHRIALAGASDIAEIATVTAHDHDVTLAGIIDADFAGARFCGLPVAKRLKELGPVDAVILTKTSDSDALRAVLEEEIGADRVFAPQLVHIAQMRKPSRRSGKEKVAPAGEPRSPRSN